MTFNEHLNELLRLVDEEWHTRPCTPRMAVMKAAADLVRETREPVFRSVRAGQPVDFAFDITGPDDYDLTMYGDDVARSSLVGADFAEIEARFYSEFHADKG